MRVDAAAAGVEENLPARRASRPRRSDLTSMSSIPCGPSVPWPRRPVRRGASPPVVGRPARIDAAGRDRAARHRSRCVLRGDLAPQLQAEPGPAPVGHEPPVLRLEASRRRGSTRSGRGRGSTRGAPASPARSRRAPRRAGAQCAENGTSARRQSAPRQEPGDAAAARHIRLQHVDGAGLEQSGGVAGLQAYSPAAIAIPAGARSRSSASPSRSSEAHRLLELVHAVLGESLGAARAPLPVVGAVGVDHQLGVVADRLARDRAPGAGSASGSRPTFIFTERMPASTQPPSCSRSCSSEYEVKPPLP